MAEFLELRVAYPGHPYVARIDGFHATYDLDRCFEAGDWCYHRREFVGAGRQEQVYRLPLTPGIWEVQERVNGIKIRRYVLVFDGALHRINLDVVDGLLDGTISFATGVETQFRFASSSFIAYSFCDCTVEQLSQFRAEAVEDQLRIRSPASTAQASYQSTCPSTPQS